METAKQCISTVSLPGVCVATRSPHDGLDMVFAVRAQVFSETHPVEACEPAHTLVSP